MFRILSIDGGGVRGIFPAYLLKLLADQVPNQDLRPVFDLIVGTSTGGLIAAGIACGISLERIVELYESRSKGIFGRRRITFRQTMRSAYASDQLRALVDDIFTTTTLGDVTSRLILPATDISNGNVFVMKSA